MAGNIWKILGIKPTGDIVAIKRAYTSLAHKINPEDEPEKFRELHEAYRAALQSAKNQGIFIADFQPEAEAGGSSDISGNTSEDSSEIVFPDMEEIKATQPEIIRTSAAVQDQEIEETDDNTFDFSSLAPEEIQDNTINNIIDDIVDFRERNKLTSVSEVKDITEMIQLHLARVLFGKYHALAHFTGDQNVWLSFLDEPLIKSCNTNNSFREWLKNQFDEDTLKELKIDEICEEQNKALRSTFIHEIDVNKEKEKRRKLYIKGVYVPLIVCFVITIIFLSLSTLGIIEFNDIIVLITASLWITGGMIILFFLIYQYGDKRVRSGG